jgi:putrescine transport system permease protein
MTRDSNLSPNSSPMQRPWHQDRRWVIGIPYVWLTLFFLLPFLLVIKISLSKAGLTIPPYKEICEFGANQILHIRLFFGNYSRILLDDFYASAFATSLSISLAATSICLVVGYTMAYGIARAPKQWRPILLLLIILPFWTSFLVRVYAWMGLLGTEGVINSFLLYFGFISKPLPLLYNNMSVMIGIVYCYLPFMILPIYAILDKIDPAYWEAASDLGCRPWQAFWRITVPLSMPGIISGCILVFIPAIGEFVIPELLGSPDILMIGRVLWMEFFNNRDWPVACALAVSMLVLFVVPVMLFQKLQMKSEGA